ncbi:hypothetical protein F4801DRAFT_464092 [Xylaria longipes]|nr:hypothetical protein F4801DRAFT_464092 [Xylaria longipes]
MADDEPQKMTDDEPQELADDEPQKMTDDEPPKLADAEPPADDIAQFPLPWIRDAQIVNQGTRSAFPPFLDDPKGSLRNHLSDHDTISGELYVLDLLQRTRTTGLKEVALQLLLGALVEAVPKVIQDKVGLHLNSQPASKYTGVNWFSQRDEDFEGTLKDFKENTIPPLNSGNKEFVLWVVNGGTPDIPYYITIVLRYGPLDRITHWAIIDALAIEEPSKTTGIARNRLAELLKDHGIADAVEHKVWVPPYQDGEEFASGLVAYSAVAQLLDRIGILYCTGMDFDGEAFFSPMRPWFNPDALRAETIGRAAMKAMARLKWKVRLAMFPVQPFTDGQREGVEAIELAPSESPPLAHMFCAPDVSGDVDSLFEEPKQQDAVQSQGRVYAKPAMLWGKNPNGPRLTCFGTPFPYPPRPGPDPPAPVPVAPSPDPPAPVPVTPSPPPPPPDPSSSSSSSSSSDSEHDDALVQNYIAAKFEDVRRVREEVAFAEAACEEAEQFAGRLIYEVLEAPQNNIPSAYAVERLFWLVRRAIERVRSTDQQAGFLRRSYTSPAIHADVMHQLRVEREITEFQEQIERLREMYTTADQHLSRAYAARAGRAQGQLADVDDVAEPADKGAGGGGGDPVVQAEDSDDDEDVAGPARNPKKRRYNFETTSTIDNDGQHVYTMNVHRKPRKLKKRKDGPVN